jgi:hypothetical protein
LPQVPIARQLIGRIGFFCHGGKECAFRRCYRLSRAGCYDG